MPVILIVVLAVIAVGALAAVVVPAVVSDPVPPPPPARTELRAPEFPGVAVDSTKVALPPVYVIEEAPADSGEEANPYDAILEDEWNANESLDLDDSFTPDPEPLVDESAHSGGMVRGLGGF